MQETKKRISKSLIIMDTKGMDGRFTIDRISNLPCNVIDNILKYLPLRDAVRTSILSRGWQYKWQTIPHLVFDRDFERKLLEKHTIESVIYQVLLLHKGSIVKFEYSANSYLSKTAVYQWLHFLSNHRIEELTICFSSPRIRQRMPHHLFNFDHLKHLYLQNCMLKLPSVFKGVDRLVTLDLSFVRIESGGYTRFISKCPMLDHLKLDGNNSHYQKLEIDAPNLKYFSFVSSFKLPSICFQSTSILEEVSITLHEDYSPKKSQGHPQSNLLGLSSIRKLELHAQSLQCMARSGVPHELPNSLIHLNVFGCAVDFLSMDEVRYVVCLIRSSPNIQTLNLSSWTPFLTDHFHDVDMEPSVQFLKEQRKWQLNLSHLKIVKIFNFIGSKPEMEFVKLILSAATGLITLELKLNRFFNGATEEGYSVFKRLARFWRASSEAKIITEDYIV